MWRNWNRYTLPVQMKKGEATRKTAWQFLKQFNIKLLCSFTPRYTSKKIENRCSNKDLHRKVHSRTTQNDQKKTIQCTSDE